jgi:putative ABC transport system substrate-binding protein
MTRREFITLLGSAAASWPLATRAQQKPTIGFLNSGSANAYPDRITAFHQGLRQLGYVEGENVTVDYRWALGEYEQLPAFAAELVERRVSILIATGGEPAALAAKSATSAIPIVFAIGGHPIKLGLVASYNRPGGNATGVNILAAEMDGIERASKSRDDHRSPGRRCCAPTRIVKSMLPLKSPPGSG